MGAHIPPRARRQPGKSRERDHARSSILPIKDRYGEIGLGSRELNQRMGSLLIVIQDTFKGRKWRGLAYSGGVNDF